MNLSLETFSVLHFPITSLLVFIVFITMITSGYYVYKDSKKRNMNIALWTTLAVLVPFMVGLLVYVFKRPNINDSNVCSACGEYLPQEKVYKSATKGDMRFKVILSMIITGMVLSSTVWGVVAFSNRGIIEFKTDSLRDVTVDKVIDVPRVIQGILSDLKMDPAKVSIAITPYINVDSYNGKYAVSLIINYDNKMSYIEYDSSTRTIKKDNTVKYDGSHLYLLPLKDFIEIIDECYSNKIMENNDSNGFQLHCQSTITRTEAGLRDYVRKFNNNTQQTVPTKFGLVSQQIEYSFYKYKNGKVESIVSGLDDKNQITFQELQFYPLSSSQENVDGKVVIVKGSFIFVE